MLSAALKPSGLAEMQRSGRPMWFWMLSALFVAAIIGAWLWTPDKSRAVLELRYLRSATDYLDVSGVRLHVRDTGPRAAPAIVLLHGMGASLHTWEPWSEALSDRFRVVRYDIAGFGLTGPDPTGVYTLDRDLQTLADLLDRLGIKRASLAGNSMGGRIAWNFAARYPTRVDRLVLIAPDGFASPGFEYDKFANVPSFLAAMTYALPKSMLHSNLTPAYADPSKLSAATVTRYHDMLLVPGVRGAMLARMGQTKLERPEPILRGIQAPTLLVWGQKDAMIPITNAADYQAVLASAELVVLPSLGHVPHEEDPLASLAPVRAFLQR